MSPTLKQWRRLTGAVACGLTAASLGLGALEDPTTAGPIQATPAKGGDGALGADNSADGGHRLTPPEQAQAILLTGIVRDFRRFDAPGGHPDFQQYASGPRVGLVAERLDADGKPVLVDTRGWDTRTGMIGGTNAITSPESFREWFRGSQSRSMMGAHTLRLAPGGNGDSVFSGEDFVETRSREGFFPADGRLLADGAGPDGHNWFFTFELDARFEYRRGSGQRFSVRASDDLWVFIDGRLVIDLGGVHPALERSIDLDRAAERLGIVDGGAARLQLFCANRRSGRSELRLSTNLGLSTELGAQTAARSR